MAVFVVLAPALHPLWGQSPVGRVTGRVATPAGEPLPFATIKALKQRQGALADLNGRFALNLASPDTLEASYLGHRPQRLFWPGPGATDSLHFVLPEAELEVPAVEVRPGINPAHRLVRNAVANRNLHSPDRLQGYRYLAYNKLLVDAQSQRPLPARADSFLQQSYLLLWESLTERLFRNGRVSETVLASRISGAPSLPVPFTPTSFQGLSFYANRIAILGDDYLSPLATSSLQHYFFYLQDTLFDGPDTVFVLQFRPQKATDAGFSGSLHLHSARWALQAIDADLQLPNTNLIFSRVHIQQIHSRVNDTAWFPLQLRTDVEVDTARLRTALADSATGERVTPVLNMAVTSTLVERNLDTLPRRREFGPVEVDFLPNATRNPDSLLAPHRPHSLSAREANTYVMLDSLVEENDLERRIGFFSSLAEGRIQAGPVDVDLMRLYNYNVAERHRIGLGLWTNDRVARWARFGAWAGYGTLDRHTKWGADAQFVPWRRQPFARLHLHSSYDLVETGFLTLPLNAHKPLYRQGAQELSPRYPYLRRMHYRWRSEVAVYAPSLPNLTHRFALRRDAIRPAYDYRFEGQRNWVNTEAEAELRWAPRERYLRSLDRLQRLGSNWPVFHLRITQGLQGLLEGAATYTLLDGQATYQRRLKGLGQLNLLAGGGWRDGNLGLPNLYAFRGNDGENLVAQRQTLNLMGLSRFYADRYALADLQFQLSNTRFPHRNWSPEPRLQATAAWGQLSTAVPLGSPNDAPTALQGPSKGYYELGLCLVNLLPKKVQDRSLVLGLFGVGVFYRLGPYQSGQLAEDLRLKLTFDGLGF